MAGTEKWLGGRPGLNRDWGRPGLKRGWGRPGLKGGWGVGRDCKGAWGGVAKTGALGNQTRGLRRMGNQTAASQSGGTWPTDARSKPGDGNHRLGNLELMMISDFQKINFYFVSH